jgi:hypothetical protein
MIEATKASIFSDDLALLGLIFPAASDSIEQLPKHHRNTGLPSCLNFLAMTSVSKSLAAGLMLA